MRTDKDEWGNDPAVQKMRVVFSEMEKAQNSLIKQLKLSSFDSRLREARETARGLFDRAFSAAASKGLNLDERALTGIYIDALIQALKKADIPVPQEIITGSKNEVSS